jgi:hypothetical protein
VPPRWLSGGLLSHPRLLAADGLGTQSALRLNENPGTGPIGAPIEPQLISTAP